MKPGRPAIVSGEVRAVVQTAEERELERRIREMLVGREVTDVSIGSGIMRITVDDTVSLEVDSSSGGFAPERVLQ